MSHIIEAEIAGLAGRKKPIRISFDRNLNIIYGLNGSGKSSLLKILHSAMSGNARILENVPFTHASVRLFSIRENMEFTRTITKKKTSKVTNAKSEELVLDYNLFMSDQPLRDKGNALQWAEDPELLKRNKKITSYFNRYLPTTRLYANQSHSFSSRDPVTEDQLDKLFSIKLAQLWKNYNSTLLQSVNAAQEKGLTNILTAIFVEAKTDAKTKAKAKASIKGGIALPKAYESVAKFLERKSSSMILGTFEQFSLQYTSNKSIKRIVDDIFAVEEQIDVAMTPRRALEHLIHKLYSGNKKIVFNDESILVQSVDGEEIGLGSLSSGEKHIIWLFIECLLASESTITIDEPELSLHIDWQHELVRDFQILNPNAQFILATHSPEIIADVDDKRIFAL